MADVSINIKTTNVLTEEVSPSQSNSSENSGVPSGPASGDLSGTYPGPSLADFITTSVQFNNALLTGNSEYRGQPITDEYITSAAQWNAAYGWGNHAAAGYEPGFSKNTAFNKNFGTAAGTVAQGNDSRINNGQTAFGWGNHASQDYTTNSYVNSTFLQLVGGTLTGDLTVETEIILDTIRTRLLTELTIEGDLFVNGQIIARDDVSAYGNSVGSGGGSSPTVVSLNDLTDVNLSAPANGQLLVYQSGSGQWINETSGGNLADVAFKNQNNVFTASQTFNASINVTAFRGFAIGDVSGVARITWESGLNEFRVLNSGNSYTNIHISELIAEQYATIKGPVELQDFIAINNSSSQRQALIQAIDQTELRISSDFGSINLVDDVIIGGDLTLTGSILGLGTENRVPVFGANGSLENGSINDNGSTVTIRSGIDFVTSSGSATINGNATFNGSLTQNGIIQMGSNLFQRNGSLYTQFDTASSWRVVVDASEKFKIDSTTIYNRQRMSFQVDTWNISSDGNQRIYFQDNNRTYLKAAREVVLRVNNTNTDTYVFDTSLATFGASLTVNGDLFVSKDGTTLRLLGTSGIGYFGTTTASSLYLQQGGSSVLKLEPSNVIIERATTVNGNATVNGNLTTTGFLDFERTNNDHLGRYKISRINGGYVSFYNSYNSENYYIGYIGAGASLRSGGIRSDFIIRAQSTGYLASVTASALSWNATEVRFHKRTNFLSSTWHVSDDGNQRLYFTNNSHTYIKSPIDIIFRTGNSNANIVTISSTGVISGNGSGLTNVNATTLDGIDSSNFARTDISETFSSHVTINGRVGTDEIRNRTGNQLVLNVGESHNYATGQTAEYLYVNAESGLQINASPDNWASGWLGRVTHTFSAASSTISTPLSVIGNLTASGNIYSNGTAFYGDNKNVIQFSDSWLRLNQAGNFSSGIYTPYNLRTDGSLQVGSGGSAFHAQSNGNLSISNQFNAGGHMVAAANVYAGGGNGFVFGNTTANGNYIYLTGGTSIRTRVANVDTLVVTSTYAEFNRPLIIDSNSAEALRLQSTGSVGNVFIQFEKSDGGNKGYIGYGSGSNDIMYIYNDNIGEIRIYAETAIRTYVNASVKLEHHASESYLYNGLTLYGIDTDSYFRIWRNYSGNAVGFRLTDSNGTARINAWANDGQISLDRIKVGLSGNVPSDPRGIGYASAHVLQSQHWYGHTSTQTMYLAEAGNTINVRGNLNISLGQVNMNDQVLWFNNNSTKAYIQSHGTYAMNVAGVHAITFRAGSNTWNSTNNHSIVSRSTSGSESDDIRINSYGGVMIDLDSNNNNTSNADFNISRHSNGGAINDILFTVNGETGDVTAKGDVGGFYSSDPRLKRNMQIITAPIEKLRKLNGYSFEWRPESSHTGMSFGLNAEEVNSVLPYAVAERANGYKAVDYKQVTPLLIEVSKNHETRIQRLERELKEAREEIKLLRKAS